MENTPNQMDQGQGQDQGQVPGQIPGQAPGQVPGQGQPPNSQSASPGQNGQNNGQNGKISFQTIHNHARQLLRQYTVEKEAAEKAGLATPEGKQHMAKAEKIKSILVTYSKRQKLLQQQQKQKQAQAQAQAQAQGQPQGQLPVQIQGQSQQSQVQVQTPLQNSPQITPQSNIASPQVSIPNNNQGSPQPQIPQSFQQNIPAIQQPVPNNPTNNNNNNMAPVPRIATPQPIEGRTLSQQISSLEAGLNGGLSNAGSNTGTTTPNTQGPNGTKFDPSQVTLTPGQQLQVKRQQLLNKYQQIITMSDQFKKNMILIQKKLQEPNLDANIKSHLLEKEHEVKIRLENCKKCTQQIAAQLKLAQQQAQQYAQQMNQQNRSQTASPALPLSQIPSQIPQDSNFTTNLNRAQSQGAAPIPLNTGAPFINSTGLGSPITDNSLLGNSQMKLNNTGVGTPGSSNKPAPKKETPTTKKTAAKKNNTTNNKRTNDQTSNDTAVNSAGSNTSLNNMTPNKKQKVGSAPNSSSTGKTAVNANGAGSDSSKLNQVTSSFSIDSVERAKFQNLNIPDDLNIKQQDPVSIKINNRPSMLGGNAIASSALSNPVLVKPPKFEIEGDRVLNKRKLKELVNSVASEEGDMEINIDGDVEELLLDLADEFVTSVTSFASGLARHRHSENLDVRDVQLHLERNWNIRIPGYAADEIRMIRKFVPNSAHSSKVNGVFINKSVQKGP
ncbi:hypothetical protein DAPK24_031290 [Pichia kluyveri]|uniref:TBP-associated factor 12 n=1 Tax=Pichia kluyveri TaxID=36015 RepID=A0AAV5R4R3_PICKL|nr:hypothetical protein DAPK24_031290 [Pichia kluyveri]